MHAFRKRQKSLPIRHISVSYRRGLRASWAWTDDAGRSGANFAPTRFTRTDLVATAVDDALRVTHEGPVQFSLPGPSFAEELAGTAIPPLHYEQLCAKARAAQATVVVQSGASGDAQRVLDAFHRDNHDRIQVLNVAADGSYNPKTDQGAWAYVIEGGQSASGAVDGPTDAVSCELAAAAAALEAIPLDRPVRLRSDSRAVVELATYIIESGATPVWLPVRFETTIKAVKPLADALANRRVKVVWTKGHAEDDVHNQADEQARRTRRDSEHASGHARVASSV